MEKCNLSKFSLRFVHWFRQMKGAWCLKKQSSVNQKDKACLGAHLSGGVYKYVNDYNGTLNLNI